MRSEYSSKLSGELESWAGTQSEYPRSKSVAQLFEEIAAAYPNATALVFESTQISYRELNRRANRLAHRLRCMGVGEEMMVGVYLECSPEMIVALLGILKAGGAYVPLDPSYPRERLDFMLADTNAPVIVTQNSVTRKSVTQKSLATNAIGERSVATILMEDLSAASGTGESRDEDGRDEDENPSPAGGPNSLAYVMYTSGSTGRPKGVLVENRSIVRLVFNTNYCTFGRDEVFLQFAPISFDASTFEIWGALLHGSKLVLMPPQASSLDELGRAIHTHGVTTLWLTAGLFHLFVDQRLEDLRPLKQLLAGGDALSAGHVRRVLENLPGITLINGYGPTEGTTFTSCHVMRHGDGVSESEWVPIGRPISNTRVYIVDENLQPVAAGVAGELCAAGDGIARGYLNSPELSKEKFVADPFASKPARNEAGHDEPGHDERGGRMYHTGDLARWRNDGTIEFMGRKDNQVKILGHRIELGEIEAVLGQYPGIREVCVVAHTDSTDTKRLVAYYVTNANGVGLREGMKDFLAAKLPAYMLPSAYVPLTALPLNPNGKVDRSALRAPVPESNQSAVEARGSHLEEVIAGVWKKILCTERVGLDDNFFDLGGDSLLLVSVHSSLQKLLNTGIKITDLFAYTTIRSLAKNLGSATASFDGAYERAQKQRSAFARQRNAMQKDSTQSNLTREGQSNITREEQSNLAREELSTIEPA